MAFTECSYKKSNLITPFMDVMWEIKRPYPEEEHREKFFEFTFWGLNCSTRVEDLGQDDDGLETVAKLRNWERNCVM